MFNINQGLNKMALIKLTLSWNALLETKNVIRISLKCVPVLWTAKKWCQHAYLFDIVATLYVHSSPVSEFIFP